MEELKLRPAEKKLCKRVKQGEPVDLGPDDKIRADVIRRLVLGLPFDKETGLLATIASFFFEDDDTSPGCSKTAVGISIEGGTIDGRLVLDSAVGEGGGPMCPMEFRGCVLDGGFSGAHAHFSRLCFNDCRFGDEADPRGGFARSLSIDLRGAALDRDLDMARCRPLGDETSGADADKIYFEDADEPVIAHHFWIGLAGARIHGKVDLTLSRLRAPPKVAPIEKDGQQEMTSGRPKADALNLSQAELAGDLRFVGGRALGRLIACRTHVNGDIWMTGARLNGGGCEALVLQSATVNGFVVLRGGYKQERSDDVHERFAARGELNFHGARLGAKLRIGVVDLYASNEPLSGVGLNPSAGPDDDVCLCLEGARVDGSVYISPERPRGEDAPQPSCLRGRLQLAYLEVANEMHIEEAFFGVDSKDAASDPIVDMRLLVAKELLISKVMPLRRPLDEDARARPWRRVSVDLEGARVESLRVDKSHFSGTFGARSLQCQRDAIIGARVDGRVELAGCDIGGSLDLSKLAINGPQAELSLKDGTIGRALRLARDKEPAFSKRQPLFPAAGTANLQGLSCETLDDWAGKLWGQPSRIKMDHFVYRHATSAEKQGSMPQPSHMRMRAWLRMVAADRVWLWLTRRFRCWFGLTRDLREATVRWAAWQVRRNWIYRQFELAPGLIQPARHPIREDQYHPQPFEQAIRVARAEGREDVAIRFEMLKARIEWVHFNLRIRWTLAAVGIAIGAGWLMLKGGSPSLTLIALALTWGLMLWVSKTHEFFRGIRNRHWRRLVTEILFYLPTFVLLLGLDRWWSHPFYFIASFLLYFGIRLLSVFAHAAMRAGFGYLRRPGRAIVTMILAFLVGWWGVHVANRNNMLVVNAEAVAPLAAADGPPRARDPAHMPQSVMGSWRVAPSPGFIHEISCRPVISEPLYALDVLIPIVDLGEERRCEVRRVIESGKGVEAREPWPYPGQLGLFDLAGSIPRITVENHRFWWWMQALYAIAGWFIVSLSILTFAQANRTHAEPPIEHK